MTELTKCERVQTDSHRKCQNFAVKVKKIYFTKLELNEIKQWTFLLITCTWLWENISGETIYRNFVKKKCAYRNMPYILA